MTTQEQLEDRLSLSTAFIATIIIACLIGISVGVGILMNNSRYRTTVHSYTTETQNLIARKDDGFAALFTDIMDVCAEQLASQSAGNKTDFLCEQAQSQLGFLEVDTLRDSSAIAYIRVSDNKYEMIEASGKYTGSQTFLNGHNQFLYESAPVLEKYFLEDTDIPLWDNYLWFIPGKEVIVPVAIDGKTVGYIFRGVIEK